MKNKIASAKNFVKRNERRIMLGTIAVISTVTVLQQSGIKSLNEFLEEKDLYDEYYSNDED